MLRDVHPLQGFGLNGTVPVDGPVFSTLMQVRGGGGGAEPVCACVYCAGVDVGVDVGRLSLTLGGVSAQHRYLSSAFTLHPPPNPPPHTPHPSLHTSLPPRKTTPNETTTMYPSHNHHAAAPVRRRGAT